VTLVVLAFCWWLLGLTAREPPVGQDRTSPTERPRVIVSTDIGGTDPDDFQSMVHFLLYADHFDIEGLVSSPYGPGRKTHILQVIDAYESDYTSLRTYSAHYPAPEALRRVTKQGAIDGGPPGPRRSTEGSEWIVRCARRADARPLWILVWGGIDDLAQALYDAPDIVPRLRVYFIGGPNKMWSVDAYDYIEREHPALWTIEANSEYRGWFTGGIQTGGWDNTTFVTRHVAGRGALGAFFATHLAGTMKMGDSPSVAYLLQETRDDPERPGWGGRFVRVWEGRASRFERLTTEADVVEAFGVVEIALPVPPDLRPEQQVRMLVDGRIPVRATNNGGRLVFRFSPRDAKPWPFVIQSDHASLDGLTGRFTAALPPIERTRRASARHPHWWTDDPDPAAAEGVHAGAKHVNRWRQAFLEDFAARMQRCERRAPSR